MYIICGISAWEYHATPPNILEGHDGPIDPEYEAFCAHAPSEPRIRVNATPAAAITAGRLAYDLKGVSSPIHIMVPRNVSMRANAYVAPRRMARDIASDDVIPLGNDLFVLSIERTLLDLAAREPYPVTLLRCLEACGLYAVSHDTDRSRDSTLAYVQAFQQAMSRGQAPRPISTMTDEHGHREAFVDVEGNPAAWTPCLDLHGQFGNLWKRPPLTSREALLTFCDRKHGATGMQALRAAARAIQDGSASPLESRLYPLLTLGPRRGGEGWPKPLLNHRIVLPRQLARVTGQGSCTVDVLFPTCKGIIEVLGKRFHDNALDFEQRTRRNAALETMGYRVTEITYEQMRDMEVFDMRIEAIADLFGLPLKHRTISFLRRRRELHEALFAPRAF